MKRNSTTKFIGLDVHKSTISVAIADAGPEGEVRFYGKIDNTTEAIVKVIKKYSMYCLISGREKIDTCCSYIKFSENKSLFF